MHHLRQSVESTDAQVDRNQIALKKQKSRDMGCLTGPICSVSSDASPAVRHKVELFYY